MNSTIRFHLLSYCVFLLLSILFFACGGPTTSDNSTGDDNTEMNIEGDNKHEPPRTAEESNIQTGLDTDNEEDLPENETDAEGSPSTQQIDYLTFSNGALPVGIYGEGVKLGASYEFAVYAIDGSNAKFGYLPKPGPATVATEFVYQLPGLTTFTRFAVPNVQETPSPSQTFAKNIEISGSTEGPESGFSLLAKGELVKHKNKDDVTEIPVSSATPVRWVKLRLSGGLEVNSDKTFFDFSELIGNGTQEKLELADHFSGIWKTRGLLIELKQDGPMVTGCFGGDTDFLGSVTGNILKGSGTDPLDSTITLFVLSVLDNGELRGVSSSNGGPFRLITAPAAPKGTVTECSLPTKPPLGCGSIVYGINFDYDSAKIRPESGSVLAKLFEGLQSDKNVQIVIGGHTSSEGSDAYNLKLSERRAQSVVDDMVRRGLDKSRIRAAGFGESNPIASNEDEAGRSMNRRVAVTCR